ncbi:MAG: gliding motility-associated C-terminal domain-containing protein [Flavobacteriales bacterium]|nr:gliding motility-associated C-terminal domain-containing protein [Flavobacteriales bacterium]
MIQSLESYVRSILSLLLIALSYAAGAQALDPAIPGCVQVSANGDVILTWTAPADPLGEFVSYEIWFSNDLTNFNSVGVVGNYNTTTFLHAGANANNNPACYYLVVNSNNGTPQSSALSDKLCVPTLNVTQSVPTGNANLQWGDPYFYYSNPPNGTEYEIWLNYPAGTWQQIDVVPWGTNNYSYEVIHCSAQYDFQIRVNTPFGCQSISNIDGDLFADATSPDPPNISYVTVNPVTGKAIVNWFPSQAPDTWGYIIYEVFDCASSFNTPLDTIYGAEITTWEWPQSTASITGEETFVIAAFDSCLTGTVFDNLSPTAGNCHSTIFLANDAPLPCEDFATLSWSEYVGWDDGVANYEIHVSVDGGPDQIVGTVPGTQLTFVHSGLNFSSQYKYFIRAIKGDGTQTSDSNVRIFVPFQNNSPTFAYIMAATVVDRYEVAVGLITEAVVTDHTYVLEKWDTFFDVYLEVATVADNGTTINFSDYDVDTRYLTYDYRVLVINPCGDTVLTSNHAHTILLDGLENNDRLSNTLDWTPYYEWDGGVSQYRVYRSESPGDLGTVITSLPGSASYYEDDVSDLLDTPGEFCYTIEAIENPNSFGVQGSSFSNQICLQMDPKIWIPNAFMIDGFNNIFIPVIGFADTTSYQLNIYSRWGDLIFTTTDIKEGWNGDVNGRRAPIGLYAYLVTVKDGKGITHNRKGTVTLLVGE